MGTVRGKRGALARLRRLVSVAVVTTLVAALGAGVAAGGALAAGTIVVNGSFEEPALATGTWNLFPSIPGWSLTYGPAIEIQNSTAGPAADGLQWIELDSTASSGIYQNLNTTVNQVYLLSFAFSPRLGTPASDNILQVQWNGQVLATISADGTNLTSTQWTTYTYAVIATGPSTRLEFDDLGTSNGVGTFLDNVSVTTASLPAAFAHTAGNLTPSTVCYDQPTDCGYQSSGMILGSFGIVAQYSMSLSLPLVWVPGCEPLTGTMDVYTSSGTLTFDLNGSFCESGPMATFQGTWTITGGTGGLVNAMGAGTVFGKGWVGGMFPFLFYGQYTPGNAF